MFLKNRFVIFLKFRTSTSYISNSTGSFVTSSWFSPFNAHGVVIFDIMDFYDLSESSNFPFLYIVSSI